MFFLLNNALSIPLHQFAISNFLKMNIVVKSGVSNQQAHNLHIQNIFKRYVK